MTLGEWCHIIACWCGGIPFIVHYYPLRPLYILTYNCPPVERFSRATTTHVSADISFAVGLIRVLDTHLQIS